MIYGLRDAGEIVALGGGVYRWADAAPADLDHIEIAERTRRGTLCLDTAMARHDLTDAIPPVIDVALPRGDHRPRLLGPVGLHVFDPATFDIGRETMDVGARRPLGIYSPERCVGDAIRLRHREGSDVAWEALRRGLRRRGHSPARLLEMARHFRGAERAALAALHVLG